MTIVVINPNASVLMTEQLAEACQSVPGLHHEVIFTQCDDSPKSIEGFNDGAKASYFLQEEVRQWEEGNRGAKPCAYVIACFDDTGLDAARELTSAPVIGIGEAAMHAASMVSYQFCIMTAMQRSVPILERNARLYGLDSRCAGVFASGIPVLELESDPDSYGRVVAAAKTALTNSNGEALVLGCAGMSHWLERMTEDLAMPVIDGARTAIKLAEALSDLGLQTSKVLSYGFPERK